MLANDFTLELGTKNIEIHQKHNEAGRKVSLVDTGLNAMTGARIKRVEDYIDDDIFMLTYGDGVIDLGIKKLLEFHEKHGKIGTVTGVSPQLRYGELLIEGDHVLSFDEKPKENMSSISRGYFVFNKKIFDYVSNDDDCGFEKDALQKLARDGELKGFLHDGFWQCRDTFRDYIYLQGLFNNGKAVWKKR